jgi:DNA-binding MarR family transcriptional regulator
MIEEGTTITRLLDKLEDADLVRRERSVPDRRQVLCFVTDGGRKLLDTLDPLVNAGDEEAVAALSGLELERFIDLLDVVRRSNSERGAPRTAAVRSATTAASRTR